MTCFLEAMSGLVWWLVWWVQHPYWCQFFDTPYVLPPYFLFVSKVLNILFFRFFHPRERLGWDASVHVSASKFPMPPLMSYHFPRVILKPAPPSRDRSRPTKTTCSRFWIVLNDAKYRSAVESEKIAHAFRQTPARFDVIH